MDDAAPSAKSEGMDARELGALLGVRKRCVHDWGRRGLACREKDAGKGKWLYQVLEQCGRGTSMQVLRGMADALNKPSCGVIYARVSSPSEASKLQEQVDLLRSKYPEHQVFTDTGSGLDHKRKGFGRVLQLCFKGEVKEICVTTTDRLCHVSYDLLATVLQHTGVRVRVERNGSSFTEQELSADMMAVTLRLSGSFRTLPKRAWDGASPGADGR